MAHPIALFVVGFGGFILYFAPSIVALARGVPSRGSVLVVNLFLGWTGIGWVVALAIAARSVPLTAPLLPYDYRTTPTAANER